MTTPLTSPAALPTMLGPLIGQWARFFTFLRRPALPERASGPGRETVLATLRMLLLDLLVTLGVLGFFYLLTLLGVEAPDNALADLDITPAIVALIVLGAPFGEEILFRSWLSGRPGHVLALLLGGIAVAGVPVAAGVLGLKGKALVAVIGVGGGFALAGCALWHWRGRAPWRWFARIFPVLLPLSALLFASVHLFNYEADISPLLWLFVLPQFLAGLIFGYARVNFGLWSSMLLHALHNGTAIGVILLLADK